MRTSNCPRCYGYMSGTDWAWGSCPHCGWQVPGHGKNPDRDELQHRHADYDAYQADEAAYDTDCEDAW